MQILCFCELIFLLIFLGVKFIINRESKGIWFRGRKKAHQKEMRYTALNPQKSNICARCAGYCCKPRHYGSGGRQL